MAITKQTPIQRKVKRLYASFKRRTETRYNKNGKVSRYGQPLRFTEDQLELWFCSHFATEHLESSKAEEFRGCVICPYSGQSLTWDNCAVDHKIALSRGGSPGLDNLEIISPEMNQFKGKLTPEEFKSLRSWLSYLPEAARNDIEGRLKRAIKLAAGARWAIKKKAKKNK